jgi:heme-degrading monooxygenase HmoA
MVSSFHLAQVNIARMLTPLTDPVMAGFVARLAEINRLAESSPGFVWRLTEDVNPFEADILFNLSVWESPEALKQFVYRTSHKELLAAREDWFQRFDGPYTALWWIPVGEIPPPSEARVRLEHLRLHGDSSYAFRFQSEFAKAAGVAAG